MPPHGLHRMILHAVRTNPRVAPNFLNAAIEYCEQVGMKRHAGGVSGDICVR